MEEYYFKTTGWDNGTCTEKCKVKDNGVMIGSVKCQQCEFCVEHQKPCEFTGNVNWIKCSKLDEAISSVFNCLQRDVAMKSSGLTARTFEYEIQ